MQPRAIRASLWQRGAAALRAEPALVAFVALAAIAYLIFSLVRYDHFAHSGFDLGIFDQVVWHYSRFEAPSSSVKGLDYIWGDHFSPILALLAPLYWIWEDARMLLIAQALLLAAAAVPIFLIVRAKLGRVAAYLFALAYLAFWGLQSALSFEFHELAFAPLLIALVLLAIERRRWGAYFPLLIALLCVKEDMSILVFFLGIYVMSFGLLRQGLTTLALGVIWYVLVVKLLIPHYSSTGDYVYWSYSQFGDDPLSALAHAITHPEFVVRTLFGGDKTHTLWYLTAPFLGLMLCSRTAILLVPLVAERFLSTNELLWTTGGHYALTIAAILVIGAADGLANLRRLVPVPARRALVIGVAGVVLVLNVAFSRSFTLSFTHLTHGDFYETPASVKDAKRALAAVPPGVSVAATDDVIPRLVHREVAAEISPGTGATDYVVALVVENGSGTLGINGGFGVISRYVNARLSTHVPVAYVNGWLVLRARSLPPVARAPQLVPLRAADAARVKAAQRAWMTAFDVYLRALARCVGSPQPRACAEPLGGEFRRRQARLERELVRVRPSLTSGCLQQSSLAAAAARTVAGALEATRSAAAQGATADLKKRSVELQQLQAQDATGYVTRFVALCVASRSPGKGVS